MKNYKNWLPVHQGTGNCLTSCRSTVPLLVLCAANDPDISTIMIRNLWNYESNNLKNI